MAMPCFLKIGPGRFINLSELIAIYPVDQIIGDNQYSKEAIASGHDWICLMTDSRSLYLDKADAVKIIEYLEKSV